MRNTLGKKYIFFEKIFGYIKKKLYLCALNCDYIVTSISSHYEEKYTIHFVFMLLCSTICAGSTGGAAAGAAAGAATTV